MMPLITVQGMGALYVLKSRSQKASAAAGDNEIIELWEVA